MDIARLKELLERIDSNKELPGDMTPSEERQFFECGLAEELCRFQMSEACDAVYDSGLNPKAPELDNFRWVILAYLTETGKRKLETLLTP